VADLRPEAEQVEVERAGDAQHPRGIEREARGVGHHQGDRLELAPRGAVVPAHAGDELEHVPPHVPASAREIAPAEEALRVRRRRRRRRRGQPVLLLLREHLERAAELEQHALVAAVLPQRVALLVEHRLARLARHAQVLHRLLHGLGRVLAHARLAPLRAVDEGVRRADRRVLRGAVVAEAAARAPRVRAAIALRLELLRGRLAQRRPPPLLLRLRLQGLPTW